MLIKQQQHIYDYAAAAMHNVHLSIHLKPISLMSRIQLE